MGRSSAVGSASTPSIPDVISACPEASLHQSTEPCSAWTPTYYRSISDSSRVVAPLSASAAGATPDWISKIGEVLTSGEWEPDALPVPHVLSARPSTTEKWIMRLIEPESTADDRVVINYVEQHRETVLSVPPNEAAGVGRSIFVNTISGVESIALSSPLVPPSLHSGFWRKIIVPKQNDGVRSSRVLQKQESAKHGSAPGERGKPKLRKKCLTPTESSFDSSYSVESDDTSEESGNKRKYVLRQAKAKQRPKQKSRPRGRVVRENTQSSKLTWVDINKSTGPGGVSEVLPHSKELHGLKDLMDIEEPPPAMAAEVVGRRIKKAKSVHSGVRNDAQFVDPLRCPRLLAASLTSSGHMILSLAFSCGHDECQPRLRTRTYRIENQVSGGLIGLEWLRGGRDIAKSIGGILCLTTFEAVVMYHIPLSFWFDDAPMDMDDFPYVIPDWLIRYNQEHVPFTAEAPQIIRPYHYVLAEPGIVITATAVNIRYPKEYPSEQKINDMLVPMKTIPGSELIPVPRWERSAFFDSPISLLLARTDGRVSHYSISVVEGVLVNTIPTFVGQREDGAASTPWGKVMSICYAPNLGSTLFAVATSASTVQVWDYRIPISDVIVEFENPYRISWQVSWSAVERFLVVSHQHGLLHNLESMETTNHSMMKSEISDPKGGRMGTIPSLREREASEDKWRKGVQDLTAEIASNPDIHKIIEFVERRPDGSILGRFNPVLAQENKLLVRLASCAWRRNFNCHLERQCLVAASAGDWAMFGFDDATCIVGSIFDIERRSFDSVTGIVAIPLPPMASVPQLDYEGEEDDVTISSTIDIVIGPVDPQPQGDILSEYRQNLECRMRQDLVLKKTHRLAMEVHAGKFTDLRKELTSPSSSAAEIKSNQSDVKKETGNNSEATPQEFQALIRAMALVEDRAMEEIDCCALGYQTGAISDWWMCPAGKPLIALGSPGGVVHLYTVG